MTNILIPNLIISELVEKNYKNKYKINKFIYIIKFLFQKYLEPQKIHINSFIEKKIKKKSKKRK